MSNSIIDFTTNEWFGIGELIANITSATLSIEDTSTATTPTTEATTLMPLRKFKRE